MPTDGRILRSIVAASLFATVMAWTGSAGNERAVAATLPPPIVTKAVPLGTAPKHAVPHGTSATAEAKPVRPSSDNGTAARQPDRAAAQEPSQALSDQEPSEEPSKAGSNAPAEAPKPLMLQAPSSDLKIKAQSASPQQQNVASPRQPAANTVIGSNALPQGEPQSATAAKTALPSPAPPSASQPAEPIAPPPGSPPPASEAKIEQATPPEPAGNQAPVSQPPDLSAPSPSPVPPTVDGKTEAPASEPAIKTEPGTTPALPDTAKPSSVTTSPNSGIRLGAPSPSPHHPQMAEDHSATVASPPSSTPSVPLAEPPPAPPPAGPSSPPPEKPFSFPLGLGFAAAVLVLLIGGLIAFAFGRGGTAP